MPDHSEVTVSVYDAAQTASDARQSPRVNVSWAAKVVVGPQSYMDARVINVSRDGLGLVSERAFVDGSMLPLVLAVPDPADRGRYHYPHVQMKVVFQVVRGATFRVGTSFLKVDDATRRMIEQWVEQGWN